MRVALICPFSNGPTRGNITTVNRIATALGRAGVTTRLFPLDVLTREDLAAELDRFAPDLVHGFHARFSGGYAVDLARERHLPVVVTTMGSDLNDPDMRNHPETTRAMTADAVVCFDSGAEAAVADHFPAAIPRVRLIPQGVTPLPATGAAFPFIPTGALVLFLPALVRPVKNVAFPLQALAPLAARLPHLRLVIAGGVQDPAYADRIRELLTSAPWAHWPGEVPYAQMGDLYRRADLVLNCSLSESMPNSLLEAMALGRPVLAADIPGNRYLVQDGETGWLYRSEAEFCQRIEAMASDRTEGERLGRRARERALALWSPALEAERYGALYRALV